MTHSEVLAAANILRLRAWVGAWQSVSSVRALLRGDALSNASWAVLMTA